MIFDKFTANASIEFNKVTTNGTSNKKTFELF